MVKEMDVEGVVDQVIDKKDRKGQTYKLVRIGGEGYFDWNGKVANASITEGDSVRLRATEEEFSKIQSIEKNESKEPDTVTANQDSKTNGRERNIIRISCLRSAAMLMANSEEQVEAKQEKVLAMAQAMAAWVTNATAA